MLNNSHYDLELDSCHLFPVDFYAPDYLESLSEAMCFLKQAAETSDPLANQGLYILLETLECSLRNAEKMSVAEHAIFTQKEAKIEEQEKLIDKLRDDSRLARTLTDQARKCFAE